MIKLIATDMDGTLLNSKKKLSYGLEDTLKTLEENNILFAPTSGRNYQRLKEVFKDINAELLFISDNGNYITHKGKVLYENYLSKDDVKVLVEELRKMDFCRASYSNSKGIYTENKSTYLAGKFSSYKAILVKNILTLDEDIIKCAILSSNKNQDKIINRLKSKLPHLTIVKSSYHTIDVCPPNTNKGVAIEKIKDLFGISSEEVMVFGDYLNDLEMMDSAYYSYAMNNAHPQLKEKARFIAKSNDENGVVCAINDYLRDNLKSNE